MNQSPRDWLLARHAEAEPELDALRRAALPKIRSGWRGIGRELFWRDRFVWVALAAVWVVISAVRLSQSPISQPPPRAVRDAGAWLSSNSQINALLELDALR